MDDEEWMPEAERRALVDVTVDPPTMLKVRDELRQKLVTHHHQLKMAARAHRKVGDDVTARRLEASSLRVAQMIWTLDNPMDALTDSEDPPSLDD